MYVYIYVYISVFFRLSQNVFSRFSKTHFFRYFLEILKFGPENIGKVVILS